MKIVNYKGHEIDYNPNSKQFNVSDKWFATQDEAEKYIDKVVRAERSDFKRIPAILTGWQSNKLGTVTSIVDNEAWFTSQDGREKAKLEYLFHATEANLGRLRSYKELTAKIEALEKERRAIKFDSPILAGRQEENEAAV